MMKSFLFLSFLFVSVFFSEIESFSQDLDNNLFKNSLIRSLSSETFLSNASVKKNGRKISSNSILSKSDWNTDNYSLRIDQDSLKWVLSDQTGDSYQIDYPNDFSLFYGKDKKELQDELVKKVEESRDNVQYDSCPKSNEGIVNRVDDEKYGLFKKQYFLSSDSKRVYDQEFPIESLVNTFVFPEDCHIAPRVFLKIHLYGIRKNELVVFPGSFSKSILTSDWKVWSNIENEKILLLFEHPFLNFQHMLFLEFSEEIQDWRGDFYSFIPNSNVGNLFREYNSKEFQLKLKVE